MRPDVAALYPAYPGVDRAGWDFEFPCGTAGRGAVRVQVVVEDAHGLRQVIGTRTVSGR